MMALAAATNHVMLQWVFKRMLLLYACCSCQLSEQVRPRAEVHPRGALGSCKP